jgi:non-lysosomal glucosylceramidase
MVYQDKNLTGIDFPIGAVGGSVIRMNGRAERARWQIFHNYEQREGSGVMPNSFFAIRTKAGDSTRVRALQTTAVGPFPAMRSLTFSGEFPFGWYSFQDDQLPVKVTLEAYNPLIPMDLKNSAIPCAIFRIKVKNPTGAAVEVGLLATQQNAVGFSGYDTIGGENQRQNPGYGSNRNQVIKGKGRTGIALTGPKGSMNLSAHADAVTATASWKDVASLLADFESDGALSGPATAESPAPQITVDAALSSNFHLEPGAERSVTFVLSWHFPGGCFGRADIPQWHFVDGGNQYENWWASAADVDAYVAGKFDYLDSTTRLYHQTVYSSNIPRYALDRMTSNLCVLKSPTSFWTKNGYFGIWESTSDKQEWFGNCKHVIHYAQGHARLFPELGRILRDIDLRSQLPDGLFSDRDGGLADAMDGHFGTILGVYREHLLSVNNDYLKNAWPRTRKAMDYAIERLDPDRDGMFSGSYHTNSPLAIRNSQAPPSGTRANNSGTNHSDTTSKNPKTFPAPASWAMPQASTCSSANGGPTSSTSDRSIQWTEPARACQKFSRSIASMIPARAIRAPTATSSVPATPVGRCSSTRERFRRTRSTISARS